MNGAPNPEQFVRFDFRDLEMLTLPPTEPLVAAQRSAAALFGSFGEFGEPISRERVAAGQMYSIRLEDTVVRKPSSRDVDFEPSIAGKQGKGYRAADRAAFSAAVVAARFLRTPPEAVRMLMSAYVYEVSMSDALTAAALVERQYSFAVREHDLSEPMGELGETRSAMAEIPLAFALMQSVPHWMTSSRWGRTVLADQRSYAMTFREQHERAGAGYGASSKGSAFEHYYRYRLRTACDFIDIVVLFDAFSEVCSRDPRGVARWCSRMGLELGEMLKLAERRGEILSEAKNAGLDPAWLGGNRLRTLMPADFDRRVAGFKQMLLSGLRLRCVHVSENRAAVVAASAKEVAAPQLLPDKHWKAAVEAGVVNARWTPPRVAVDSVRLVRPPPPKGAKSKLDAPIAYKRVCGFASVLSGFVDVDDDFMSPEGGEVLCEGIGPARASSMLLAYS